MSVLLSIITINLNNKDGLSKTIESIEQQTFKDFEFIIVDGNSSDGSIDIINSKQSIIQEAIIEPDSGIYNAMNKGIKRSNGIYLYFLNSGDILYKNTVLADVFNQTIETSFICTNFYTEVQNKKTYHNPYQNRDWSFSLFDIYSGYLCHQAFFIKKEMFQKYGYYNENLKIVSDWELFFVAIGMNNENVVHKNVDLVIFNGEGLSSTIGGKYIYNEKKIAIQKKCSKYLINRLDSLYTLEQDKYIIDITKQSVLLRSLVRIYGKVQRIFK